MPISSQILRPAKLPYILFTLLIALILALIPWGKEVRAILPDFVALTLFYWCLHQPRQVGVAWAFWLGILLDVADGALLGQHAFAYCLSCWVVLVRGRQLSVFPIWQQALYLGPLLLANELIMLCLRLLTGSAFPGWLMFVGAISGVLVWPFFGHLLQSPQRSQRAAELKS